MKNRSNPVVQTSDSFSAVTEEISGNEEKSVDSTMTQVASSSVLAYMDRIKPPDEEKGASSWSKAQMAETPTLLPTLKFHDLVFGHDLGEGSFGSVRYARLIDRTTTRSNWPEYAVKIISTEKIKEMGYEASVQRELAVLRVLSHPCIARLVSSFRFREGVYLVLEYASGGDLHTLLKKNGSLDHDSTRFVIGEVTSALASIHEMGLVYADLKPENIVITETGHVKLTDFGGSRPVTDAAKKMISESAKNGLGELRDGGWKKMDKKNKIFDMVEDDDDGEHESRFLDYNPDEDLRIEGTTIYLPPEVVMGAFPGPSADSWALGCVLFQCLTGRPPILEEDEALARNRIVSFDAEESKNENDGSLFGDSHGTNIEPSARSLIVQLLNRHAKERPSMTQVAEHCFFQDAGVDVFSLYQRPAHPLDVGDVAPPSTDAKWSRRQLSSIWAPQPQAYDISLDFAAKGNRATGNLSLGPISEGDEAPAFFSKSSIFPTIRSQVIPLPPRK
jgi:serine/threonine protein kinase